MLKRMIVMLVVMAALIAGLGFLKFQQIQTAIAQGAAFQPPPEAVTTIVAKQEEWPDTLDVRSGRWRRFKVSMSRQISRG